MGPEPGSSTLVESGCSQNRLQLSPAPPGVLSHRVPQLAPPRAVAGQPLRCERGDPVTLYRRCSVWALRKILAYLLKVVAPRTASSSDLLRQGCSRKGQAGPLLTGDSRPASAV